MVDYDSASRVSGAMYDDLFKVVMISCIALSILKWKWKLQLHIHGIDPILSVNSNKKYSLGLTIYQAYIHYS
jgi:hypothetical protein